MCKTLIFTAAFIVPLATAENTLVSAEFVRLGALTIEHNVVSASHVSDDGLIVIGQSGGRGGSPSRTFSWTAQDGMRDLGSPMGRELVYPAGMSSDGSVIVVSTGGLAQDAFTWTADHGFAPIAGFDSPSDMSADGATIVGTSRNNGNGEATRWTAESGVVELGFLPGGTQSFASDMSADASVVVGRGNDADSDPFHVGTGRAFRWTAATDMQPLGDLGGNFSRASDVSADGRIIVGDSETPDGVLRAFRWTEEGMISLGSLDEHNLSSGATAVSEDGATIAGWGVVENELGIRQRRPFLWDEIQGMRDLEEVLVNDFGLVSAIDGWRLNLVHDLSFDGRVLVGSMVSSDNELQHAFSARLDPVPEPSGMCLLVMSCFSCLAIGRRRRRYTTMPS